MRATSRTPLEVMRGRSHRPSLSQRPPQPACSGVVQAALQQHQQDAAASTATARATAAVCPLIPTRLIMVPGQPAPRTLTTTGACTSWTLAAAAMCPSAPPKHRQPEHKPAVLSILRGSDNPGGGDAQGPQLRDCSHRRRSRCSPGHCCWPWPRGRPVRGFPGRRRLAGARGRRLPGRAGAWSRPRGAAGFRGTSARRALDGRTSTWRALDGGRRRSWRCRTRSWCRCYDGLQHRDALRDDWSLLCNRL
jgi:hypothetical protein